MELFLKIYNNQFSASPSQQVFEIFECEIEKNVREAWRATVIIPPYITWIKQYNWVEIYEPLGDLVWDKLIFRWFIANRVPELTRTTLEIKSEKYILKNKSVVSGQIFTWVSISSCLTTLLSAWNAAWAGENYSVSTTSTYNITSKQVKTGDNLYDIIEEVVSSAECVWDCVGGVIKIAPSLGVDYTTWTVLKELIYDAEEIYFSNITDFKLESFGSIANIIYGSDGTNNTVRSDSASIALFSPLTESKSFRKTDVTWLWNETQSYLNKTKGEQFSYVLKVDSQRFEADVWDKIILTIQNLSPDLDFSWYGFINRKKMKLVNATMQVEYELSDKYFVRDDFFTRFRDLEANVNLRTFQ